MADRLYPPSIAGTLPSFYTDLNGTTNLVVPFSMNQSVSVAAVKGMFLRLKRTTTDTLLTIQSTANWDSENLQVIFELSADTIKKLTVGDYYKVQIAYYNLTDSGEPFCGHYSTVSIVKYTQSPTVGIQGLEAGYVNSVSSQQFVGNYKNADISEKVYQYRFVVDRSYVDINGNFISDVLADSGWLIHDSTTDTDLSFSTDSFILTEVLSTGINYTVQYFVITNNGLQVNSPQFQIVATQNLGEIVPCKLHSALDYENARIRITATSIYSLDPSIDVNTLENDAKKQHWFSGNYQLIRTDSHSNFKTWTLINTFQLSIPMVQWEYWDYIIESGVVYKYGIQKITVNNVRSARSETVQNIVAYFEDAFLYDGERQLRIRYNTNVSSIKDVIAESKKTTLGSKYPFVLRNGYLNYKEFPITGLLSYLSDNEELFMTKDELLHPTIRNLRRNKSMGTSQPQTNEFIETTDQTDENVTAEKNFAMFALSWLNNGSIKLFKSSQEGNYIVKCTNCQLAPVANTGRMLHTFSCTVDEVQEYTSTALLKYDILRMGEVDSEGHSWDNRTQTYIIQNVLRYNYSYIGSVEERRGPFSHKDFTDGRFVQRIEITEATPGDLFKYGNDVFAIPQSGKYTIVNATPIVQELNKIYIEQNGEIYPKGFAETDVGIIKVYYQVDMSEEFEYISTTTVKTYYGFSGYGDELAEGNHQSSNILWEFAGPKKTITAMYDYVIHSYPLRQATNAAAYANESDASKNDYGTKYGGYLYLKDTAEDAENLYYKFNKDENEFQPIDDLNISIRVGSPTNNLINIQQYSTDESQMPDIDFEDKSQVYWTLGSNVFSIFYMQVQEVTYSIEYTNNSITTVKDIAEAAKKDYYMKLWNFKERSVKPTDENTQIYIYNNDHFSAIQLSEWSNYDEHFEVNPQTYTPEEIQLAYNTYYQKQNNYETTLQYYLEQE